MTLQQLNTVVPWPGIAGDMVSTPAFGTGSSLDAAGEYYSVVACARQAKTISHVGFRSGACTGSPTADIRIETVGADGLPTGTLWAANTNIVTATLVANTFALHALTAPASIAAGQMYCVKVGYNSGTSFVVSVVSNISPPSGLPYTVKNTGTPTKGVPLWSTIAIGSGATTFYGSSIFLPCTVVNNNAFNNTSSARRGVRFKVPFKCRCVGLRHWNSTSAGDFNIILFNEAGTELSSSSTAVDGDHSANTLAGSNDIMFDNPVTLSPDTWYRAALEPSTATNITLLTFTLPSADYRSAWPGGLNHHYTTYVASSWTDTATDQIPLVDILIDQLDDGASAGGATATAHANS